MLSGTRILALVVCLVWLPAIANAGAPIAILPFQELEEGRNGANLPFTRALSERLAADGNELIDLETLIDFMANNRIRTLGRLETFHLSRVEDDLGAGFVLLGTVTQRKDRPQPMMGLTLNLVRTSDVRTVWSYVRSFSTGDQRKPLGVGEPDSLEALQALFLDDIMEQWPWEIIRDVQQAKPLAVDSFSVQPSQVRPGGEVHAQVRLRREWPAGRVPRVFFKANDQLYGAKGSDDGLTYEATWVAGEKSGRNPVTLVLEMPPYGRTESAFLGTYMVDGTPPLFEIDLRGVRLHEGVPRFQNALVIIPKHLVRKPLDHWRLSFFNEGDDLEGSLDGKGNLPERFLWRGLGSSGPVNDGTYKVVLEAWDEAGNSCKASREVVLDRRQPKIDLALTRSGDELIVNLEDKGKVPLAYWRMEMWTQEGKLLTETEGKELPARIGIDLAAAEHDGELLGFVFMEDIMGNRVRRKVQDLLPKIEPAAKSEEKKESGVSREWVDEF